MTESQQQLEWKLHRLEMLRKLRLNRAVDRAGLQRGRLPILDYLCTHEGASQRAIADAMHISPPSVAVTVRRMEKDGLLVREGDTDDQRVNRLYTTALGRQKVETCHRAFMETVSKMTADFTDAELDALGNLIDRLYTNLSDGEYDSFSFFPMFSEHPNMFEEDAND